MKIRLKPFAALVTAWNRRNNFQRARLQLTGVYIVLVFLLLNIFTGSIFFILQYEEKQHSKRIEVQWEKKAILFPKQNLTIVQLSALPTSAPKVEDILTLHHLFLRIVKKWIIAIEGVLLFFASIVSYFLSGRTLRPIEEHDRRQKQFLADISHELKNPLAALQTSIDIAKDQKQWKQGELRDFFSEMQEEVKRLISITEDLLFLESRERGKRKPHSAHHDIENVIRQLTPLAKKRNIHFQVSLTPYVCHCQPKDMMRVVFNLLHNAIKFSPANSTIGITLTEKGVLSITDEGIGIPKEEQSRIFHRFYKSDSARPFSEESGTGLGLALVKKICDANGWKICVRSTPKRGSCFTVRLR